MREPDGIRFLPGLPVSNVSPLVSDKDRESSVYVPRGRRISR